MMQPDPETTAVVSVNYKKPDLTMRMLDALFALQAMPEVIVVVDNASDRSDCNRIFEHWSALAARAGRTGPSLKQGMDATALEGDCLLAVEENLGFAKANNLALNALLSCALSCTAIWLLNNDAFPEPDALKELCAAMQRTQAGLVGSTLVYAQEKDLVQCAAGGIVSQRTGITRFLCGMRSLPEVLLQDERAVSLQLGFCNAASLLVHRQALEQTGGFSEDYFLYYEDVDFSTRARLKGVKLAWARQSVVRHEEGASSGASSRNNRTSNAVAYYSTRNRLFFISKFYRKNLVWALLRTLFSLFLSLCRGRFSTSKAIVRAVAHFCKGTRKDAWCSNI